MFKSKLIIFIIIIGILTSLVSGCTVDDPGYIVVQEQQDGILIEGKINGTSKPIKIDSSTHALITVATEHAEVHEGEMYTVSDTVVADTTTVKWQITTADSDKYAHLVFSLFSTGEATYIVTEGSDRTDGILLNEVNKRRIGTVDIAETVVTRTPTGGTTDGAIVLFSVRTGSTGVAGKTVEGGSARAENEYILKPDTKYVVSITTYAAVYATMKLDWYEHEDLN